MKFRQFGKLPSKPSELIRLAMLDLEKAEKDLYYTIDMDVWHEYRPILETCSVCLAGSMMSGILHSPRTKTFNPGMWDEESLALRAVDQFRQGWNINAFLLLAIPRPKSLVSITNMPEYDTDPERFKGQMHYMADEFARKGY